MNPRYTLSTAVRIFLFLILHVVCLVTTSWTAPKTCYDCHKASKQEFSSQKSIHQPVKEEKCETCHKRHGFSQSLILVSNDDQLCFSCHADLKDKYTKGTVHTGLMAGNCWSCHDPHASNKPSLLRTVVNGTDDPASCLLCHGDETATQKKSAHAHKPFADLKCLSCHNAHNSDYPALLSQPDSLLCNSCHAKDKQKMAAAHDGKHTTSLACIDCHSGHASTKTGLLSATAHQPFAEGNCTKCHALPDATGAISFAEGSNKETVCASCHADQAKGDSWSVPHPAVSSDNCSECHAPHNSRFGNLLVKDEGTLCLDCHGDVLTESDLGKHEPVILGQCSACHDVHGSDKGKLLKVEGPDLCLQCHADYATAQDSARSVHAEAESDCLSCHNAHEGIGKHLLKKTAEQLCVDCHEPDPKAISASSSHQPYVTSNCAACHSPHFSKSPSLLRSSSASLCLTCHQDVSIKVGLAHPHSPAEDDCLSCHNPHYANEKHLQNAPTKEMCLTCHDGADLGLESPVVHSSAKDGDCTGCHNPHGSERPALLSARVTSTLVQGKIVSRAKPLSKTQASLCYTCHETFGDLIEKSAAHAPVKQGNCDACHAAHGSDHGGFVKSSAPELCAQCHTADTTLRASHSGYDVAKTDCLDCHNPHVSTSPKLVRASAHPPFVDQSCDLCHEQAPTGEIVLADSMTALCAGCHDGVNDELTLTSQHAPFAKNECTSCHRVHAADEAKLLKGKTASLCIQCHTDLRKADTLPSVHAPFAEEKCLDCHTPHASKHRGLLIESKEKFCFSCHGDLKDRIAKGTVHEPVESGDCNSCHQPHAGPVQALLINEKKELCSDCHDLGDAALVTSHRGFEIASSNCQDCHDPHVGQAGRPGLLYPKSHVPFTKGECQSCHTGTSATSFVAEGKELCKSCHNKTDALIAKAVKHPGIETSDGCTNCHASHVGFGKELMKKDGVQQCLSCHNGKEFTGTEKHAPAFEDCSTCHDPHSSDNKKLLSDADIMGTCLTCHDDATKTHFHPMGKGVIDPRTKSDLTCIGCHSPHSSNEKVLLLADRTRKLCNNCHETTHE